METDDGIERNQGPSALEGKKAHCLSYRASTASKLAPTRFKTKLTRLPLGRPSNCIEAKAVSSSKNPIS